MYPVLISLLYRQHDPIFFVCFTFLFYREFTKRIGGSHHFHYCTTNERYREWEDELPSFNEVPDDVDPSENPLTLHRLTLNRQEDASIFIASRSFLPPGNQTTICQRLHRPEGQLPPV